VKKVLYIFSNIFSTILHTSFLPQSFVSHHFIPFPLHPAFTLSLRCTSLHFPSLYFTSLHYFTLFTSLNNHNINHSGIVIRYLPFYSYMFRICYYLSSRRSKCKMEKCRIRRIYLRHTFQC